MFAKCTVYDIVLCGFELLQASGVRVLHPPGEDCIANLTSWFVYSGWHYVTVNHYYLTDPGMLTFDWVSYSLQGACQG